MKVLLVGDACGVHESLLEGLSKRGVDAKLLMLTHSDVQPMSHPAIEYTPSNRWLRPWKHLYKAATLEQYDIISFAHRISFVHRPAWMRYWDLPFIRKKARLLSYIALGCDEISLLKYNDFPYKACNGCELGDASLEGCLRYARPLHSKAIQLAEKYFDLCIVASPEYKHAADHFPVSAMIPFPFHHERIPFRPANFSGGRVKVVHSVTRPLFKGTDRIEAAIAKLQEQSVEFEYVRLDKLPWPQYLEAIADADIIIDQVWGHNPGMAALTGMSMGKLVFTGNTVHAHTRAPWISECPAFDADPDADVLASSLQDVIRHWPEYASFPAKGRDYVRKYHDPEVVAAQYLEVWTRQLDSKQAVR
jgi:glycosyltransferase involved in cell wall biosynthesis